MTPNEAYARLDTYLRLSDRPLTPETFGHLRTAWQALNEGIAAGAELPNAWCRLSSGQAAARAGKRSNSWTSLVAQGYAPEPDGFDSTGHRYWYPATVDRWLAGH